MMGLDLRQAAALLGAGYSMGAAGDCDGFYCQRNSFLPSSGAAVSTHLSNVYFNDLLSNQWEEYQAPDRQMFKVTLGMVTHPPSHHHKVFNVIGPLL